MLLSLKAGLDLEVYTFIAQGGFGQYAYSLPTESEEFNIDGGTGVLSANNDNVPPGVYQVTVRVEDEDGSRAESIITLRCAPLPWRMPRRFLPLADLRWR